MPQHPLTPEGWASYVRELDRRIEECVSDTTPEELADGYRELAKLRHRQKPDYEVTGLAAAYAISYLPVRVSSLTGALALNLLRLPVRIVFDVGAGCAAAAFALNALQPDHAAKIVLMEPSDEMKRAGRALTRGLLHEPAWLAQRMEELPSISGPPTADLVLLSCCFDYDHKVNWEALVRKLMQRLKAGGMLVAIEPGVKAGLLLQLKAALDAYGTSELGDSSQYDVAFRQPIVLPRTKKYLRDRQPRLERLLADDDRALEMIRSPRYLNALSFNPTSWYKRIDNSAPEITDAVLTFTQNT